MGRTLKQVRRKRAEQRQREDRRWRKIRRERGVFRAGVIAAAPFLLQVVDLLFPTTARTLLEYFTCRNLDEAGWYLEADYNVACWEGVHMGAVVFAFIGMGVYVIGIPLLGTLIVRKYVPA